MHLKLNYFHFWLKKDKKIAGKGGLNRGIEVSPFGLYVEKIVDVKFFGNFKKKSQKWPTQDLSNIEGTKSWKISPFGASPED